MGKSGRIERWVHTYLAQPHPPGNAGLLEGLKKMPRYWIGPIKTNLCELVQVCGPDSSFEFHENAVTWDIGLQQNIIRLEQGDQPPHMIVEYTGHGLRIADGNHRYAALKACGYSAYWAIIWCNSRMDYEDCRDKYLPGD
ncbi:MAG TPA: hypothetical protein VMF29_05070 [Candidatus Edwardsbacteria bacterium]|nr:hypothetical protein [Candidatus Edwardsbacteria bacterium]